MMTIKLKKGETIKKENRAPIESFKWAGLEPVSIEYGIAHEDSTGRNLGYLWFNQEEKRDEEFKKIQKGVGA